MIQLRAWLAAALSLLVVLPIGGLAAAQESQAARASGTDTQGKPEQGTGSKPSDSSLTGYAGTEVSLYADDQNVTVTTPEISGGVSNPSAGWSVNGSYLADIVSAASVDIVSTASARWQEVRHAGSLQGGWDKGDFATNVSGSVSSEPDYLAFTGGATLSLDLAQANYTLLAGYAYGHDTVGRRGTPFSVFSHIVQSHTVTGSLQMVLNRSAFLVLVGDARFERGDNSKPYRYIPMFAPDVAPLIPAGASINLVNQLRVHGEKPLEQLPTQRDRYAVTARFAYRWDHATLRLSERLYTDSWDLRASTTTLRAVLDLSKRWSLWPMARYHLQGPVNFWKRAYTSTLAPDGTLIVPALRTGDRELSPMSTLSGGLGLRLGAGRGADPDTLAFELNGQVMQSWFTDTVYLSQRLGFFGALTMQALF